MKVEVFHFLCSELAGKCWLEASKYITVEEKVGMFLWTMAHSASNRAVQERLQHSGETVSRCFHQVLQAITRLVPKYIRLPVTSEIPIAITSNPKFYSFFNDCVGALDGTHIAAKVSTDNAAAFRNRKGWLSQNVLASCDLDKLCFTYVLAGWEGSAHDGAVLEAAFDTGFEIPHGKYYLGDAGYPLTPWCLTPYRGENEKELFNLRHSSLRNAIERIFGVLKKRFKVLTHQGEYPYKIQVRLIKVLCCLHNIIRIVGGDDWFDEQWIRDLKNADSSQSDLSNEVMTSKAITAAQTKQANMMRDDIAEKMWSQYSSK